MATSAGSTPVDRVIVKWQLSNCAAVTRVALDDRRVFKSRNTGLRCTRKFVLGRTQTSGGKVHVLSHCRTVLLLNKDCSEIHAIDGKGYVLSDYRTAMLSQRQIQAHKNDQQCTPKQWRAATDRTNSVVIREIATWANLSEAIGR